jgi:hypothetical protein
MGTIAASLLCAVLAADPSMAVVIGRRTAVPPGDARTITNDVSALLQQSGVTGLIDPQETNLRLAKMGMKDATTCAGKRGCIAEIGRQLQVKWLVLISLSEVAAERSIAIELLEVASETITAAESMLLPQKTKISSDLLDGFNAQELRQVSPAPLDVKTTETKPVEATPKVVTDSSVGPDAQPREVSPQLVPLVPTNEVPVAVTQPARTKPKVVRWVLVGGAAASLVTSVLTGVGAARSYDAFRPAAVAALCKNIPSPGVVWPGEISCDVPVGDEKANELTRLRDTYRGNFATSVVTGILAAGLGVGAVIVW